MNQIMKRHFNSLCEFTYSNIPRLYEIPPSVSTPNINVRDLPRLFMRKYFLLLTIAAFAVAPLLAKDTPVSKWKIPSKTEMSERVKAFSPKASRKAPPSKVSAEGETYNAVLQSFYNEYWDFFPDGGDATAYSITIKRDGDKVTISNFMNCDSEEYSLYGYTPVDVVGTYDEATHTISIPCPHAEGSDYTVVATDETNEFQYVLMAGNVSFDGYDGYFEADSNELLLYVEGDFEKLTTRQHIGLVTYNYGSLGYISQFYANFLSKPADTDTPLCLFNSEIDLGKTYPYNELTQKIQLINLGGGSLPYTLTLPSDAAGLTADPTIGMIEPCSTAGIEFRYLPGTVGTKDFRVAVAYETDDSDGEAFINIKAEIEPAPDFSAIAKGDDMVLSTGYDVPFEVKETDGVNSAVSTAKSYYTTSWLEARFSVPESSTSTLNVKGIAKCSEADFPYAGHTAEIIIDGSEEPVFETTSDAEINEVLVFEPGDHSVRFSFTFGSSWTEAPDVYMAISELSLANEKAEANDVELVTPMLDFGGLLLKNGAAKKTAQVVMRNKGTSPLRITGFSSSTAGFSAELPEEEAALMATLNIPVTFDATAEGTVESTFTFETSAGYVTVPAVAVVRTMPDFSSILDDKDNIITVCTDENSPFLMNADNKAANCITSAAEGTSTESSITFTFSVPEGKLATISWLGDLSMAEEDICTISIDGPSAYDTRRISENGPVNSDGLYDEYQAERFLEMTPGVSTLTFRLAIRGGGEGESLLTLGKISASLADFDSRAWHFTREQVHFADVILDNEPEGSVNMTISQVLLHNDGDDELRLLSNEEIEEFPENGAFGYLNPQYVARHGSDIVVDMQYCPENAGKHEQEVTILSTFGEHKIKCVGKSYTSDGMILKEDFDTADATKWEFIDADGDGNNWMSIASLDWYQPSVYCFSGLNALISFSERNNETYAADNYAVSPAFDVPAGGGMLSWWVSPYSSEAPAEYYELFVVPASEYTPAALGTSPAAFSETLKSEDMYWKMSQLDLAPYAGKTVRLAFRHKASGSGSALRLDDVYAYTMEKWNSIYDINAVESVASGDAVETVYFNVSGLRVSPEAKGVKIKRTRMADGTVKVEKVID